MGSTPDIDAAQSNVNNTHDAPQQDLADKAKELQLSSSLEDLQTGDQRRVLDTVAEVRKCGLDTILSLPQIVVCGQQSSGKSSVLEALTEISFPRSDNLCTRYATEIILRRGPTNILTIKVIPDSQRPANEQSSINNFKETIEDFKDLPRVMGMATSIMGIDKPGQNSGASAFARDVLCIEIEGPSRPQLTLVDIPGLIEAATKGVSESDVNVVNDITTTYISQPRTICLAVIAATSDYGTQRIITEVKKFDKDGDRTLGNEDVFFKLGWHVVKNRKYEEDNYTLSQRNDSERSYFQTSNFKVLPQETVGIDTLRTRLSALLFEHVKRELPNLRKDLDMAMSEAKTQLDSMGDPRSDVKECRKFLSQVCLESYQVCKGAVGGIYEGSFFAMDNNRTEPFSPNSPVAIRRLRALVQLMNNDFSEEMRTKGHKYNIPQDDGSAGDAGSDSKLRQFKLKATNVSKDKITGPERLSRPQALEWVKEVLVHTRGREVLGTFNPLLIGELFWEQSSKWEAIAKKHVDQVSLVCEQFLGYVLSEHCPKDVQPRFWSSHVEDSLKQRNLEASKELRKLLDDPKEHPVNYNHYFTETINNLRKKRNEASLKQSVEAATSHPVVSGCSNLQHETTKVHITQAIDGIMPKVDPNMENVSCDEALDSSYAIYKVMIKTFVSNVTIQVVERHIVRGLEFILNPLKVVDMVDAQVELIAKESPATHRQRAFIQDRISKLEKGRDIFRSIMGSVS